MVEVSSGRRVTSDKLRWSFLWGVMILFRAPGYGLPERGGKCLRISCVSGGVAPQHCTLQRTPYGIPRGHRLLEAWKADSATNESAMRLSA